MRMERLICLWIQSTPDTALYSRLGVRYHTWLFFSGLGTNLTQLLPARWLCANSFTHYHLCVSAPQLQKGMIALKLLTVQCCYEYSKTSLCVYVRRAKHGPEGELFFLCLFISVSACTSIPLSLPPRFHLPHPYSALSPQGPCPQTLHPKTQLNISSGFTSENIHIIPHGLNNHEY